MKTLYDTDLCYEIVIEKKNHFNSFSLPILFESPVLSAQGELETHARSLALCLPRAARAASAAAALASASFVAATCAATSAAASASRSFLRAFWSSWDCAAGVPGVRDLAAGS